MYSSFILLSNQKKPVVAVKVVVHGRTYVLRWVIRETLSATFLIRSYAKGPLYQMNHETLVVAENYDPFTIPWKYVGSC